MKFIKRNKFTIIFGIVGILFAPFLYLLYNKTIKLTPFEIMSFEQNIKEEESFRTLSWSESKFAQKYEVVILDSNLKVLEVTETTDTKIKLDDVNAKNGENIIVNVNAVDKFDNKKSANVEDYKIKWVIPTFGIKDGTSISNQEDLFLDILNYSDYDLSNYSFVLYKNDTIIYKDNLTDDDKIYIPNEITKTLLGDYTLELKANDKKKEYIADKKEIKFIAPKIDDILVTYPMDKSTIPYNDFNITFTGGDNAIDYYVTLIDNSNKSKIIDNVKQKEKTKNIIISSLKENREYTLIITADNPMDSSVNIKKVTTFKTAYKFTADPVEADTPNGTVTWGKSITLRTNTPDAVIYYTTDGSIPTLNSNRYTNPIKINSKVTIKAIATKRNMNDSIVTEFRYTPKNNALGSNNKNAPTILYNPGFLPVRYFNQRTGGYSGYVYGPAGNDWDNGKEATIASHGCGPTAVAMVVATLTEKDISPIDATKFACQNGYCSNTGTATTFISDYCKKQGLKVEEVNKKDKDKVINALKSKNSLAIAVVGPGTFTTTAHFIVLRGATDDGKVLVADPNSLEKSKEFHNIDTIIKESKDNVFYVITK